MALEDIESPGKYIDDLVSSNPFGSDPKKDGDGHLRGIKNVLKLTFPNLDAPVTATPADLNDTVTQAELDQAIFNEAFPTGTRLVFPQAAPPIGWIHDTNYDDCVLMVSNSTPGGGAIIGDWEVDGLSSPTHTHTNVQFVSTPPSSTVQARTDGTTSPVASSTHLHDQATASVGFTQVDINSNSNWRPSHVLSLLCTKD